MEDGAASFSYEGEWRKGKRHGAGSMTLEILGETTSYVGNWKNGLPHGEGAFKRGNDEQLVTRAQDAIPSDLLEILSAETE